MLLAYRIPRSVDNAAVSDFMHFTEVRRQLKGNQCIYCGMTANSVDHFPPKSLTFVGWILPACIECNIIASNHFGLDFEERYKYVKSKLMELHKKVMETPSWSKIELKELGYPLWTKVQPWQNLRELISERIAWNVETYLLCIDSTNDFANWLAEIAITTSKEKETLRNFRDEGRQIIKKNNPKIVNDTIPIKRVKRKINLAKNPNAKICNFCEKLFICYWRYDLTLYCSKSCSRKASDKRRKQRIASIQP